MRFRARPRRSAVGAVALAVALALAGPAAAGSAGSSPTAALSASTSTPSPRSSTSATLPGSSTSATSAPTGQAVGGPLLASTGVVVGRGVASPPTVEAAAYVVADLDTGDVLAAKAPHQRLLPASTLKILTALTLLPELDKAQVVVGTDQAAAVEGSKAGISPGLRYSLDLVFKALLMQSGNDAAETLALAYGGVPATVAAMNDVAAELHALDTVAVNPSGLDHPTQLTSAYDLALITRAALEREDFRTYLATPTADMPDRGGGTYQIQNENRFVADYDGAIGVKNGYTELARHTFVGAAERAGRSLVVTVLRTEGRPEPVVAALMDWGFANVARAEPVGELVEAGGELPVATPAPVSVPPESDSGPGSSSPGAERPVTGASGGTPGAERDAPVGGSGDGVPGARSGEVEESHGWLVTAAVVGLCLLGAVALLRARAVWRRRERLLQR